MGKQSGAGGTSGGRLSGAPPDPHDASVLIPIVLSVLIVGTLAFGVVSIVLPERHDDRRPTAPAPEEPSSAARDSETDRAPSLVAHPSRPTETMPQPVAAVSNTSLLDRSQALQALQPAEEAAKSCSDGTVPGVRVVVTFGQDGSVQEAKLIDSVGDRSDLEACVLAPFRQTRIQPFRGKPMTVFRSVVFDDAE